METREHRPAVHYRTLQGLTEGALMAGDSDEMKRIFSRNLQAAMNRKGWNQSEMARRACMFLPKPTAGQKRGKKIGRDNISHYVRANMLPSPVYLEAIAQALGMKSGELMPFRPQRGDAISPVEMMGAGAGRVYLRINRTVRQEAALKIMAILADEDKDSP